MRRRVLLQSETEVDDGIIDLSMVDNAGNKRKTRTTANCYLVHKIGDYKLPLVYGNAIKNGQVNTAAFYPDAAGYQNYTGVKGFSAFRNHKNALITKPWITKSTTNTGIDGGMGLTASTATLLWQDSQSLITSVSVSEDYLYFTVGNIGPGNALIAIKDSSNNIMWSWHIWLTQETLESTCDYTIRNKEYKFANCPIGWVPQTSGSNLGTAVYYQGYRKDPFVRASGPKSNSNHTVYNISNQTVNNLFTKVSKDIAVDEAIKNPCTLYVATNSNRGVYGTYYDYPSSYGYSMGNFWNSFSVGVSGGISTDTSDTVKTVYDPCPPDFCVPSISFINDYLGSNTTINISPDNTNNMYELQLYLTNENPLKFHFIGNRDVASSSNGRVVQIRETGTSGYYGTSSTYYYYGRCTTYLSMAARAGSYNDLKNTRFATSSYAIPILPAKETT